MNKNVCKGLNCTSSALIEAHIVPRGFARIARENGHIIKIEAGRKPAKAKSQLGVFDDSLLCAACDGKLGRYDGYTIEFCRAFAEKQKPYSDLGFQVQDIDTDLLRKGVLAILWRASLSQRPECQTVSLGHYEQKSCDVLFGSTALKDFQNFQVVVQRYMRGGEWARGFYTFPRRQRFDDLNVYVFGLVGLRFLIKMDARPFPSDLQDFVVREPDRLYGTNVEFNDTSEGREMQEQAQPLLKYRSQNAQRPTK